MTLIFIISALVSHFFRSFRVSLIAHDSALKAALGNCVTFTLAAVATKFIAISDWWLGISVECAASFIACYIACKIYERSKK